MLKKAAILTGAAAASALVLAPAASADGSDNDGVNALNGNNISAVPVQLCDANVIGKLVNQDSPEKVQCVNAPLTDHPKAES